MRKRRGGQLSGKRVVEILRLWGLGKNKSEISRAVSVTRATVRDYVSRASALGLGYEQAKELSDDELSELFEKHGPGRRVKHRELNFEYLHRELSRPGVTRLLLWEEYIRENPEGYGYSQFCLLLQGWQRSEKLSLRRTHKGGEAMEVDYAGQTVPILDRRSGEVLFEAQIFVACLPASNKIFCEATSSQELRHWLGSHVRAFKFFGGVPKSVIPDNLKSGVKNPCFYDPELNPSYRELAEHYQVAVLPARVRKPKDKAKAENAVQQVERRILAPLRDRDFSSVAELNQAIASLLSELNAREMKSYRASRNELFENIDKPALSALPAAAYRFAEWKYAKVNIDYHVEFEGHFYSVPYSHVHSRVEMRIAENTLEVFLGRKRIALHSRNKQRGAHTTCRDHMPKEHRYVQEWSPSRFLSWAEKIGRETKLQIGTLLHSRDHPEQGYRACLGILRLAKKYGPVRLEAACEKANSLGLASYRSINSMLKTGHEKKQQQKQTAIIEQHTNIRGNTHFH